MHALKGEDFGRFLFRFAVIADTHVNPEDGRTSSPFATNALSNERGRFAIADINRHDPLLVVHVGDLVHPVPELPSFAPACQRFKELASALKAPLYLAAGNHDVGDKSVDWMPAGTVTQAFVDTYRQIFGPDFYSFDAADCHFIVINAQIINSGLPAETGQRVWLEQDFAAHQGKRTFFFTHYPPFVCDRHEASNYDNIDEPGRSWLLDLLKTYRPEALFAGHVHHQWYDIFENTECYILPSTAFVRQDYTELFKLAPGGQEHGRDETPKLGYYLVEVHEHGHVAHFMRMNGRMCSADAAPPAQPAALPVAPRVAPPVALPLVHSRTNLMAPVGVDLRHPWVEWMDIAATGGVQEFERKRTRNDYPLVALWETGVRKLRVPIQDLLDPGVRSRMALLRRLGHRFTAYVFGAPNGAATTALYEHRGLIEALEVVLPWRDAVAALPALSRLRAELGLRLFLSKLRLHEDAQFDGSTFNHFINHGFVAAEHGQMQALLETRGARAAFDGYVMRVVRDHAPAADISAARELAASLGIEIALQVRLAGDNPADPLFDDLATANRVAETLFAAIASPQLEIFFDTFVDVDRGYFPHAGFVDRRYDPRMASLVMRHMHAALGETSDPLTLCATSEASDGRWIEAHAGTANWLLFMPASPLPGLPALPAAPLAGQAQGPGPAEVIDLSAGVTLAAQLGADRSLKLGREWLLQGPALFRF